MDRPPGGDDRPGNREDEGRKPLYLHAKNGDTIPGPLLLLLAIVIGNGMVLGLSAIAVCLTPITGLRKPPQCDTAIPTLSENHSRTIELVVSLAAGAALGVRR